MGGQAMKDVFDKKYKAEFRRENKPQKK